MPFSSLDNFLKTCIKKNKIPGCSCWVGDYTKTLFFKVFGYAQRIPDRIKLSTDTLFDVASITKPVATAVSAMLLYEEGHIKLNDKVKRYLPSFRDKHNGRNTIEELLTHTSGIPAWFPLYVLPEAERLKYLGEATTCKREVLYSCLGFILLGLIIEAVTESNLDVFCKKRIYEPIGLSDTLFKPGNRKHCAATEFGSNYEKKMASQYSSRVRIRWRNHLIKGEVHDGNSFYAFSGVSGNAGLFSTAQDLGKMMQYYCAREIVNDRTYKMMTRTRTRGIEKRSLGWILDPYPGIVSSSTFYHTGFTGTMLLVDPKLKVIIVLLSNAVHPAVRFGIVPKIRQQVVQIVSQIVKEKK